MRIQFGWRGEDMYRRMQGGEATALLSPSHLQPNDRVFSKRRRPYVERDFLRAREDYIARRESAPAASEPLASQKSALAEMSRDLYQPMLRQRIVNNWAREFGRSQRNLQLPGFKRLFGIHDVLFNDTAMAQFLQDTAIRISNAQIRNGSFKPSQKPLYTPDNRMFISTVDYYAENGDTAGRRWAHRAKQARRSKFRSGYVLPDPKRVDNGGSLLWPGQCHAHLDFFDPKTGEERPYINSCAPVVYLGYSTTANTPLGLGASFEKERFERSIAFDFGQHTKDGATDSQDSLYSEPFTDYSIDVTPTAEEIARYRLGPDAHYGTFFNDRRIGHAASVLPINPSEIGAAPNEPVRRLLQVRGDYRPLAPELSNALNRWFDDDRQSLQRV